MLYEMQWELDGLPQNWVEGASNKFTVLRSNIWSFKTWWFLFLPNAPSLSMQYITNQHSIGGDQFNLQHRIYSQANSTMFADGAINNTLCHIQHIVTVCQTWQINKFYIEMFWNLDVVCELRFAPWATPGWGRRILQDFHCYMIIRPR